MRQHSMLYLCLWWAYTPIELISAFYRTSKQPSHPNLSPTTSEGNKLQAGEVYSVFILVHRMGRAGLYHESQGKLGQISCRGRGNFNWNLLGRLCHPILCLSLTSFFVLSSWSWLASHLRNFFYCLRMITENRTVCTFLLRVWSLHLQ